MGLKWWSRCKVRSPLHRVRCVRDNRWLIRGMPSMLRSSAYQRIPRYPRYIMFEISGDTHSLPYIILKLSIVYDTRASIFVPSTASSCYPDFSHSKYRGLRWCSYSGMFVLYARMYAINTALASHLTRSPISQTANIGDFGRFHQPSFVSAQISHNR